MVILGIETSCDETAVSIIEAEGGIQIPRFKLLGSALHSQVDMHVKFGGVVPMLAKREHMKNLPLVLKQALEKAGLDADRENPGIDQIAVTVGPGLEPALWMGIKFAEELGQKWNIPVIGTNHMEGHIASVLMDRKEAIDFPAVSLLISGGHTELILLNSWQEKEKIGETKDDAVGEAYDKVARMLGLPYPGGPQISKLAIEAREKDVQLETRLPRPMIHSKDFNFSFSGLKTAVLYYLKNHPEAEKIEVAREFEDAVIDTLLSKTKKAIDKYLPKTLIIGGGVIANTTLRENFLNLKNEYPDLEILIPEKSLTTDNATMIAIAGYLDILQDKKKAVPQENLRADGNLSI